MGRYMDVSKIVVLIVAIALLPGCAKKTVQTAPVIAGESSKAGAFLAYEHTVYVDLGDDGISARLDVVRDACLSERFGACSLLSVEQGAGNYPRGEIAVRVIPSGVEPLVKLASDGAKIRTRATRAEDLAEAVADTTHQGELLARQRARLEEFQSRKDLSVADMLALSKELAALEVQGEQVAKDAAQQRRRIETNRLTIAFAVPSMRSGTARIGDAFGSLREWFVEGIADALEYFGYALPFLFVGFPLLLILRALWRRATRIRA